MLFMVNNVTFKIFRTYKARLGNLKLVYKLFQCYIISPK